MFLWGVLSLLLLLSRYRYLIFLQPYDYSYIYVQTQNTYKEADFRFLLLNVLLKKSILITHYLNQIIWKNLELIEFDTKFDNNNLFTPIMCVHKYYSRLRIRWIIILLVDWITNNVLNMNATINNCIQKTILSRAQIITKKFIRLKATKKIFLLL